MKIHLKFCIAAKTCIVLFMLVMITTVSNAQLKNYDGIKFPTKFYPILPWNNVDSGDSLKDIADCNFNTVFILRPNDIHRVEKLGLKAIMYMDFHVKPDINNLRLFRNLTDQEIENKVINLISITGNSKAIIGYFLMDEPSALDFHALGVAVAAIKKYARGKLIYINLLPNYATLSKLNQINSQLGTKTYTEYLERYINEVKPQFISYDNYMVPFSMNLKDKESASSYYTNLLEIRQISLKYNLPCWNTVCSNQIRKNTPIPTLHSLLFQAYTSLAAGYNGILWYTYLHTGYDYCPIDKNKNKTATWYSLQEVNRQISSLGSLMNQLVSTGVYFTSPAPDESLPLLPGNVVESVNSDGPMMIGEFVNDIGKRYVMIVNLSLDHSVKFAFSSKIAQGNTWVISMNKDKYQMPKMKKRDMSNYKSGYLLKAGEGVLIKAGE